MKQIYFKIFELPEHQVLVEKTYDDKDEELNVIKITFHFDGIRITEILGYSDVENRDRMFDTITPEQLQTSVNRVGEMLNKN